MFQRTAIGVVLLLLAGYGMKEAYPLMRGPYIDIKTPVAYSSASSAVVAIAGTAVHTESLQLNGGPLLMDEGGTFSTSLVLPPGSAILSLTATDRFGRTTTERRTVFIP